MENNLVPRGQTDVVIDDASHPRAVINLVSDHMRNSILNVPREYRELSEPELLTVLAKRRFKPDAVDHRLRFMFWKEYERSATNGGKMHMSYIYSGICSRDYFHVVLQRKERVAWLLCPPVDYIIAAEEALVYGVEQLRDILSLPHTMGRFNRDTKKWEQCIDAKAAGVKVEIIKLLDQRVKGAVVQTTRNLNVNANVTHQKEETQNSHEHLDERIQELEESLRNLGSSKHKGEIIEDAEVSE